MSIVEQQLVDIEIVTVPSGARSKLRLNYQGQTYNLYQAFAAPKLDRAEQQLQQLIARYGDRYLLVREVGHYSLWEIDKLTANSLRETGLSLQTESLRILELQQASLWLFQELWLQLAASLGIGQLQPLANQLFTVISPLQSRVDLDRLLHIDPLVTARIETWSEADFIIFDQQIYHIAQKKLGQEFATELTIEITQAMPDPLRLILERILSI